MKIEVSVNGFPVSLIGSMGIYTMYTNYVKDTIYFVDGEGNVIGHISTYVDDNDDTTMSTEEY